MKLKISRKNASKIRNGLLKFALQREPIKKFIIRSVLNTNFKNLTPQHLKEAYENEEDLSRHVPKHLHRLKRVMKKYSITGEDIKHLIDSYKNSFNWEWLEIWFSEDHPNMYSFIINHTESEEVKRYLVAEIRRIMETIKYNV